MNAPRCGCLWVFVSLMACASSPSGLDAAPDGPLDATAPDVADVARDLPPVDVTDAPTIPARPGEPDGCNGLRINCDRTYDRVAIAATHNAYSYAAGGPVRYLFPNQDAPIPAQLRAGIRGLGLRPCPYYGTDPKEADRVYVTHNTDLRGRLGTEPLDGILRDVKAFLDANPREVVSLYLESAVTPARVAAVFTAAGLDPTLYAHPASAPWPTLREMIAQGRRLVVFNDSRDASRPAWMHHLWDHIVDTDYNVTDAARFSCRFYRGSGGNAIYYLNQFIYNDLGMGVLVPDAARARVANDPDLIVRRAQQCLAETGRAAAVVYVDWFGQGDVVGAVDSLNRAWAGVDAGR